MSFLDICFIWIHQHRVFHLEYIVLINGSIPIRKLV